jgi:hypothetical protein
MGCVSHAAGSCLNEMTIHVKRGRACRKHAPLLRPSPQILHDMIRDRALAVAVGCRATGRSSGSVLRWDSPSNQCVQFKPAEAHPVSCAAGSGRSYTSTPAIRLSSVVLNGGHLRILYFCSTSPSISMRGKQAVGVHSATCP